MPFDSRALRLSFFYTDRDGSSRTATLCPPLITGEITTFCVGDFAVHTEIGGISEEGLLLSMTATKPLTLVEDERSLTLAPGARYHTVFRAYREDGLFAEIEVSAEHRINPDHNS